MFVFFTLLQFTVTSVFADVKFQACDSRSLYTLRAVKITGCNGIVPCIVTKGQNVSVTMDFHADYLFQNLDQDVRMQINGVLSNVTVTPDPCVRGENCTVVQLSTYDAMNSLTAMLTVPENIPTGMRGTLNWRTENAEGTVLLCYTVTVLSQEPSQKVMRDLFNLYEYDTEEELSSDYKESINPR